MYGIFTLHLVDFYGKCRQIYQSHGWYGYKLSYVFHLGTQQQRTLMRLKFPGPFPREKWRTSRAKLRVSGVSAAMGYSARLGLLGLGSW